MWKDWVESFVRLFLGSFFFFLLINLNLFFFSSRIHSGILKLDSFTHIGLIVNIRNLNLTVKDIVNEGNIAFIILIELNNKIYFLSWLLDSYRLAFSRNGNIDTEISFLNVLWLDCYSIWSDEFLFNVVIFFILWVRLANDSVFIGDFLLDIFHTNCRFLQRLLVFLCGKIDDTQIIANLYRDWNMSQFDISFFWLLWHFYESDLLLL